jgi:carbonic anhydrase/acetyltransferase-like protein (isoleucine patch superfamily)
MTLSPYQQQLPQLGSKVYIAPEALVIGKVSLGHDCSVWPMAVIRGDVNTISIGDNSNIQDGAVLHVTHAGPYNLQGYQLTVGANVTVGHRVILHGCHIADTVLIGMGSLILDGAQINSQVMIGAGSLVPPNKVLDSGYLYLGQPVVKKRRLTQAELDFLHYSAQHYVKLKNQYLTAKD